jgi:hypothetical protein
LDLSANGVRLRSEITEIPASQSIQAGSKAIVCNVGDKSGCDLPEARAYDHHEKGVEVSKTTILINNNGVGSWKKSKQIDFSLRSEWCIEYNAKDASGNEADAVQFMIILKDRNAPVIHGAGVPPFMEASGTGWYTPPKAVAVDDYDGSVPVKVVPPNFRLSTVGKHTFTYIAHDHAGIFGKGGKDNVATRKYHTVVVDIKAPILTVNAGSKFKECGTKYVDPGAHCDDALDGTLKIHTATTRAVVGKRVSSLIVYTCSDEAGLKAQKQRAVEVRDTTPPVLSIGSRHTVQYLADSRSHPTGTRHAVRELLRPSSVECSDTCASSPTVSVALYRGNCAG